MPMLLERISMAEYHGKKRLAPTRVICGIRVSFLAGSFHVTEDSRLDWIINPVQGGNGALAVLLRTIKL